MKVSELPTWVLKHKMPKTEIRFLNNSYYVYEVTSKWIKEKKRSQKITGKLLGKITEEGFIESDKYKLQKMFKPSLRNVPSIKEYGIFNFITDQFSINISLLEKCFPEIWKEIVSLSMIRLAYQSPIKNTGFYFERSFLSELYSDITLGEKRTSALFRKIGSMRNSAASYMKSFVQQGDHILIDATNIISYSEQMRIAQPGYNSKRIFDPQINLMLIFSTQQQAPVFYRVIPGNIREVSALKMTLDECGAENVTIIADKGFYSKENIETLEGFKSRYIIPLRRSSELINYSKLAEEHKLEYFKYQNRFVWHVSYPVENRTLHLFLDKELLIREEKDYLIRIDNLPEKYSIEDFRNRKNKFGTMALLTNDNESSSEKVYQEYKTRNQVETMIDAMKNTLDADTSYMSNEDAFNGWMFINFIALQFYYHIYAMLKDKKLNNKYSPQDLLMLLQDIRKAKINEEWQLCEIHGKTKKLIEKIGLKPIT